MGTVDVLATMTAEEYRKVKAQLISEGLWRVSDDPAREDRSNQRAVEYLMRDLRSDW